MKVALCACVKNENLYLDEYINYYIKLGINHMYIYDNNDSDGENIYEITNKYNDFITVINKINDKTINRQLIYYTEAYFTYGHLYDYMCFFDVDEYLTLFYDKTIQEYIQNNFYNADAIYINWLSYDDNDLICYDGRPLLERFTRISFKAFINKINYHVKSIVKTNLSDKILKFNSPHCPTFPNDLELNIYHGGSPELISINNYTWSSYIYGYDLACIKHFSFKTIEEYINKKLYKDLPIHIEDLNSLNIYKFFNINNVTNEKIKYLKYHNIDFDIKLLKNGFDN